MQIRDAIERAVPDTTEFGYTNISSARLQDHIKTELDKIHFFNGIETEKIIEFWQHIFDKHKAILEVGASVPNIAKVKSTVLEMRNFISASTERFGLAKLDEMKANLNLQENEQAYPQSFGKTEDIELLIHPENIEKYLQKEFYILFGPGSIEITAQMVTNISVDLCNHFGLILNDEQSDKIRECINEILDGIANDCRNHKVIDAERINYHTVELVGCIRDYAYWPYSRKEISESNEKFKQEQQEIINMGKGEIKEEPIKTEKPKAIASLEDAKEKLDELKHIVKATEEMVSTIEDIDKKLAELNAQVAELTQAKETLLNQINNLQNPDNKARE